MAGSISSQESPRQVNRRCNTRDEAANPDLLPQGTKIFQRMSLVSGGAGRSEPIEWEGETFHCSPGNHWRVDEQGIQNLAAQKRLITTNTKTIRWKQYEDEIPGRTVNAIWTDIVASHDKQYVVETPGKVLERCLLMTTDPWGSRVGLDLWLRRHAVPG